MQPSRKWSRSLFSCRLSPLWEGIIGLAMIMHLLLAGLAGTVIPGALDRSGVNPAVGSTVLLTTVTGVVSFLSFLGLAAMLFL